MCVLALAITTSTLPPTPPFSRIALECYRKLALLATCYYLLSQPLPPLTQNTTLDCYRKLALLFLPIVRSKWFYNPTQSPRINF